MAHFSGLPSSPAEAGAAAAGAARLSVLPRLLPPPPPYVPEPELPIPAELSSPDAEISDFILPMMFEATTGSSCRLHDDERSVYEHVSNNAFAPRSAGAQLQHARERKLTCHHR
jgi:hypothetical protein